MKGYRTVLVGTDGSITAGRAVAKAVEVAGMYDARLVVAFVGTAETGQAVLDGVVAQYREAGVELAPRLLSGDPSGALVGIAEAERADLVVVGNKGLLGAGRFLSGSVPNAVTRQAPCDVLVVATSRRE